MYLTSMAMSSSYVTRSWKHVAFLWWRILLASLKAISACSCDTSVSCEQNASCEQGAPFPTVFDDSFGGFNSISEHIVLDEDSVLDVRKCCKGDHKTADEKEHTPVIAATCPNSPFDCSLLWKKVYETALCTVYEMEQCSGSAPTCEEIPFFSIRILCWNNIYSISGGGDDLTW